MGARLSGEQSVGDCPAARQFLFRAIRVDVDPLLVAGRFGEFVDCDPA